MHLESDECRFVFDVDGQEISASLIWRLVSQSERIQSSQNRLRLKCSMNDDRQVFVRKKRRTFENIR
jgi:hypothetical protein